MSTPRFRVTVVLLLALVSSSFAVSTPCFGAATAIAVDPQYDTAHVYVAPDDFDRFVTSLISTFGGKTTKQGVFTVTPTPSQTMSQLVLMPVGSISVFGFKTPIPYPFGIERTGYLVTDLDRAVQTARASGADIVVSPFPDPIGRDAIVEWPGGVHMQLYWHTTAPAYDALESVPENRVYVSEDRAKAFVKSFITFSGGKVASDEPKAPGTEIGLDQTTVHTIRLDSKFGKVTVFATNGQLPFPYGREIFGYEVKNLAATLERAQAAGVVILVPEHEVGQRHEAMVQFPGGYVAEIHSVAAP
jgi:predicted enzyme related to lactoylglutathione lyase